VMCVCLMRCDATDRAYPLLAAALVLSAIQRGNQPFFFWWEIESVQEFVILIIALTTSLALAAWVLAWRAWFKLTGPAWVPRTVAGLTLVLIAAQLLARPWLIHDAIPHAVARVAGYMTGPVR